MDYNQRAAHQYAEVGWPVFPLVPGEKLPLYHSEGFKDATTDHGQIESWWHDNPGRNVGIATGAPGPDVLDIDVKGQESGYPAFNKLQREGIAGDPLAIVQTPSTGVHCYYQGTTQRNGSIPRAHVDFRSQGGYVVAPPSRVRGRPYEVVRHQASSAVFDWNAARQLLDPRPRRPAQVQEGTADLQRLADFVEGQPEGNGNNGLFWASCRAAEAGHRDLDLLLSAAVRAGHPQRTASRTIQSAIDTIARQGGKEAGQ